ncbi:hypothetical protein PIB30_094975 [Stylosanthes scabra]|uniref:RRM domain-containing protein n=1 Tax=Stylosanthes scabra TaxID=79078 RepID=A0ABU6XSB4_9FABA|nr:hypothetical protein [Stylosanthes scabra]
MFSGCGNFLVENHASRAVQSLNGSLLDGKTITVSEAKYRRFGKICDSDKAEEPPVQGVGNFLNKEVANISENQFGRCYKSMLLGENKEGDFTGSKIGKFD